MAQLYLILIPLFLAGSIIAFIAYGAVHRLESLLKTFPLNELTFRLYQLEQKLAQLQKQTAAEVQLVSFTVNPEHDTPAVLKEYAGSELGIVAVAAYAPADAGALHVDRADEAVALSGEGVPPTSTSAD